MRNVKNRTGRSFAWRLTRCIAVPRAGNYLRRMKAKLGPGRNHSDAHKLAVIFYTLVTKQVEYDESVWAARDANVKEA